MPVNVMSNNRAIMYAKYIGARKGEIKWIIVILKIFSSYFVETSIVMSLVIYRDIKYFFLLK